MNIYKKMSNGKYVNFNFNNPQPYGICDITGVRTMYKNLKNDMQFAGNGKYWTGLKVNKLFLDKPNYQDLVPPVKQDPIPIQDPRPEESF